MISEISHEGIVQSAEKDGITVLLSPSISCTGCQSEKSCRISGSDKKIVKVEGSFDILPGTRVNVSMKQAQGYSALFLGYILPLIIVVAALIISLSVSSNELLSGVVSLAILLPYYGALYLLRKSIGRKFTFTLNRII
jgi:sigma-E factor negative regulatory protein RseC